jgi:hypothetical protein
MAWDRRGYYYMSKREAGRVRRVYVGRGLAAEVADGMDRLVRLKREHDREALRAEGAEVDALDGPLRELDELADLVARAALLAAGYRQHNRGEWRKRRERDDRPGAPCAGPDQ